MIDVSNYISVISESSSKGNQCKFYNNGYWYKLDNNRCSEGLAEEFVSLVCKCIENFNCVDYKTELFNYNGEVYTGD